MRNLETQDSITYIDLFRLLVYVFEVAIYNDAMDRGQIVKFSVLAYD